MRHGVRIARVDPIAVINFGHRLIAAAAVAAPVDADRAERPRRGADKRHLRLNDGTAAPKMLDMASTSDHSSRTRRRHRVVGAVLVGALSIGPATLASADTEPDPTIEQTELGLVISTVLAELGLAPDAAGPIVDDLLAGVSERLEALVQEGVVDPDQVEHLAEIVDEGRFDEVVGAVVAKTRERRDAFRDAAESVLTALGIEVPEDGSLIDVIAEAGLTRDVLADLIEDAGIDLPEAPTPPAPSTTTTRPPAPATTAPPAPTPTSAPPVDETPVDDPDDAPAAPPSGYPEVAPEPRPAPEYPTRSSQEPEPTAAPRADYPAVGEDHAGTEPEEAL
jgi:hypothetical protein